jgi:hypothetical protein
MHYTPERRRISDGRRRFRAERLRSELKGLPKISVKASLSIHALRMVGKLSHAVSLETMRLRRLVQLFLDGLPVSLDLLPGLGYFP